MKPGEHKTVQARILAYAEAIGWTFVSREEAERRRGFDPEVPPADRAKNRSLFFDDLLDAKVREFNPRYLDAEGALLRAVEDGGAGKLAREEGLVEEQVVAALRVPGLPALDEEGVGGGLNVLALEHLGAGRDGELESNLQAGTVRRSREPFRGLAFGLGFALRGVVVAAARGNGASDQSQA